MTLKAEESPQPFRNILHGLLISVSRPRYPFDLVLYHQITPPPPIQQIKTSCQIIPYYCLRYAFSDDNVLLYFLSFVRGDSDGVFNFLFDRMSNDCLKRIVALRIPYCQANRSGQNKHEWVSEDYRRQRDQRKNTEEFYNTSTPKSSVNFSFRDPELQRGTDHPVDLRMNEQNLVYVELIKEDIKAWEVGSQWPFTCYSPVQERSSFPGFTDVSPEELRYEAYKARENNTYDSYVESVEKALQNINNRRNQLKNPSVQLMSIIEKYRTGQDVSAESEVDGVFPLSRSSQSPIEDMLADESSMQQNAAASFSFKLPSQSGSSMKIGASNFSFKLPSETGSKPSSQAMDSDIYTPLEKLSSVDKEQFSASTFTLGKIPTVPPPQEVCF
ncbi:hypothetical protein AVEN_20306-1 [Araneus ventricosus]|uniref:Uncharacterized protein n=1 Tax=Araneus ventricosus TaxID=182803 RepID=A0A4Y2I976_ARAVE|nr:hypothetical protein AVEN_20306-1 [Araneus ventricosus]